MQPQLFTSNAELHYTPADIAERARYVFGGSIDLDPASDAEANKTIKAHRYYADIYADDATRRDPQCGGYSGLQCAWQSSALFLNPPFTIAARDASGNIIYSAPGKSKRDRVIERWVARWIDATTPIRATPGTVTISDQPAQPAEASQAMLLVPARTDTEWFTGLWHARYTLAFIFGRLKFGSATAGAPFPSILVYYGPNVDRFYTIFEDIAACGKLLRK